MVVGVVAMLFGGRFGGSSQQMSRGKMDSLRARFLLTLDELREQVDGAADNLDSQLPLVSPAGADVGVRAGRPADVGARSARPDTWFGVARVGVGMTSLLGGGCGEFR